MAAGANIGTGIGAFLTGFAGGLAKQHVANTLERRKVQQKAILGFVDDAVKAGDVGYVESQQKNLASLLDKETAQALLETTRRNTPQAKFSRAMEMLSQGDLSGLVGGTRSTETTQAPTTAVPGSETEAFRSLVEPEAVQKETLPSGPAPVEPTAVAQARPAAPVPRKPILPPIPTGKVSTSIEPETGKLRLSLQPLGPEDVRVEGKNVVNAMLNQGFTPKEIFAEIERRRLPITPEERRQVGEEFFRATVDAAMPLIQRTNPNVPLGGQMALAAELAARTVGMEFMPEDLRKTLIESGQLTPETRERLRAAAVSPFAATPEQVGAAIEKREIKEPAARTEAVKRAEVAAQKDAPIPRSDLSFLIDPKTSQPFPFGTTFGQAEQARAIPVTSGQVDVRTQLRAANAIVDQYDEIVNRQFSKIETAAQAATHGTALRLAASLGQIPPGSGLSERDVKDASRLLRLEGFLSLMVRALGEKGTLATQDVTRASKAIPGFFETRISGKEAISVLRDVLGKASTIPGTKGATPEGTDIKDIATSILNTKGLRTESQILDFLIKAGHAPNKDEAKRLLGAIEGAGFLKFK